MSSTPLLERVLAFSCLEHVAIDDDGSILRANAAFAEHVGRTREKLGGSSIRELAPEADAARMIGWAAAALLPTEPVLLNFLSVSGEPYTLQCVFGRDDGALVIAGEAELQAQRTASEMMLLNNEFATLTREIARRSRELETTYWHLKKIQEALPLCMACGDVKGDGSNWEPVVEYLKSNDIFLSHGYCPGCYDDLVMALESTGEL